MAKQGVVCMSGLSRADAQIMVERIKNGEEVTDKEKLDMIESIMVFSPNDWFADPERWLLWQIVVKNVSD